MRLIFVYNADSGLMNTMKDIGHKLLSPATYDCLLCSLTHGTFKENPEWKQFRQQSSSEMVFLHRDEFERQYTLEVDYPAVLREEESLEVALTKEQLASFDSLQELIAEIQRLEAAGS